MNRKFIDLTGKVFGNLTVIRLVSPHDTRVHHSIWLCRCACGREFNKFATNIGRGKNVGCNSCYRAHRKFRPFEAMYNILVKLAIDRTSVELSYEDFIGFTKKPDCYYCGTALNWEPYKTTGYKLDRKNNALGYSRDNCVPCCARCNRAKSDHFTHDEWVQIGKLIRSWQK